MNTTLVVMAAGIGSRFGAGVKQLTPVGPNGELIIDYSIHDAIEAGFNKVIFIIRKELEADVRAMIGDRIAKLVDVDYAYQEITDLPEGYVCPEGRKKPWGTGQAVLTVKGKVHEPFCVINADDYYGKEGFKLVHDYMVNQMDVNSEKYDMCMAGFILKNTLSDHGGVTRGVCKANAEGKLDSITETYEIYMDENGQMHAVAEDKTTPVTVEADDVASMNMWGLPPKFLDELEMGFSEWLKVHHEELKAEYLIPSAIDDILKAGKGSVSVLTSHDKWFGVTYAEDKDIVVASIQKLVDAGVYPSKLY